jgi:hypothetical protein
MGGGMLGFKVSIASAIFTFVLFTGGIQFESAEVAYGQNESILNPDNTNSQVSDKEVEECLNILDKLGEEHTASVEVNSGIVIFQNGTKMTCEDLKKFWKNELEFRQYVKDYDAKAAANNDAKAAANNDAKAAANNDAKAAANNDAKAAAIGKKSYQLIIYLDNASAQNAIGDNFKILVYNSNNEPILSARPYIDFNDDHQKISPPNGYPIIYQSGQYPKDIRVCAQQEYQLNDTTYLHNDCYPILQNVQKTYWYTIFDYGEIDGFEAD